jgi:S1-C subfamily serine protease
MARHVMDEILKKGAVTRGWLGVTTQSLDTSMAKAFGLSGFPRGALVNDVAADSPAATSGIAKGDIILEIDGEPLADSRALGLKISSLAPGAVVKLKLTRKGKEREISVTLTESPSRPAPAEPAPREREISPRLGLTVQPLTPNRARQLGVTAIVNGIVIDDVRPGSPADEADLHRGDVIEEINHNSVSKVEEFQDAVHEDQRQPILLLIARGRIRMFVVVDPRV